MNVGRGPTTLCSSVLLTESDGSTTQHCHNGQRDFKTGYRMSWSRFAIAASCHQVEQKPK